MAMTRNCLSHALTKQLSSDGMFTLADFSEIAGYQPIAATQKSVGT